MSIFDPWYTKEMFGFTLPGSLVPSVRESGGRPTLKIRLIDDTVAELVATTDTGWVRAADVEALLAMKRRGDYRQHTRHAVGSRAAVLAMLDGFTAEEAELFAQWEYEEVKADQAERDHAVTFMNMKKQGIDLAIENNLGETLTVVGSIVALFPGYGTIIGGVMIVGGVALTIAQKNELMRRAKLKSKRALLDARLRFLKREISEAEYLAIQQQIIEEEAKDMLTATAGETGVQALETNLPSVQGNEYWESLKSSPAAVVTVLILGAAAVYVTWTLASSVFESQA